LPQHLGPLWRWAEAMRLFSEQRAIRRVALLPRES
jgi:hypothetical protein